MVTSDGGDGEVGTLPAKWGNTPRTEEEILRYILENVRVEGDCHIWGGPYDGRDGSLPRVTWRGQKWSARRLLLQLRGRRLQKRSKVYTSCENKACMNEEHFVVSSQSEMLKRKSELGRMAGGPRHAIAISLGKAKRAKLPITELPRIQEMLAQGMTRKEIASKYGVSPQHLGSSVARWMSAGAGAWVSPTTRKAA